ncbi:M23 family metallopeptidase [Streptococcus sanguinis]|uniref:M23 family metallopeptidase n=1 Tax=Streptococcus sanguinis TaxID=1305 RepID=A0A5A7ZUN5_STRSA|nr:phage tail tip lysozyme [Streptococcus sanguinis]KAA0119565.1 M23 family metallopeptidase [Streptococcus sanguinis]
MSRETRRDVREAKAEYREVKSEIKATKTAYQEAIKREKELLTPQTPAEQDYVTKKAEVRRSLAKGELADLREKKKGAKANRNRAIQRNGGTLRQTASRTAHHQASRFADDLFQDNDILDDVASARRTIRRTHADVRRAKTAGRHAVKIGQGTTRAIYGAGNRTYNLVQGRGFTRTPVGSRWETKFRNKYQRLRARLRVKPKGKALNAAGKVTAKLGKLALTVLKNPLSAKAYLILFIALIIIVLLGGIFGGGSSTVSQNEFDLTDAWTHLSKLDREKSTDEVDYWSDIDSVMMFMGYKYSDYKLDKPYNKKKGMLEFDKPYRDLLTDIWNEMNGDKDNLQTMEELTKSSKHDYIKLSKKDQEEFREVVEQAKQVGFYINYNDLEHPFSKETSDETVEGVTITKRFGYESKDKLYEGSVLQASKGSPIYATMPGTVEIKDGDFIIKDKKREFTYKKVDKARFKSGDKVLPGDEIGAVGSEDGQEVFYKKLKDRKKKEWVYVNPGFYLPNASYTQTTSVLTNIEFSGDVAQRVQQTYKLLKKYKPNITKKAASAIMGNFLTESNITAKRAEGDYLNPPIGASANSWDDPNWISLNGPAIYNGRYRNIVHRGLGLGQWTDTEDGSLRHTMLLDYAKSKNKKWYDLELQIEFMFKGDSPYYIEIVNRISESNDDISQLTKEFLVNWEGNPGDKLLQRQDSAKQVLSYLENGSGSGGASFIKPNGKYAPIFNQDYWVMQPYGFTPWSSGAGGGLYGPSGGKHTGVDLAPLSVQYGTSVLPADVPVYSITDGTVYNTGYSAVGGYQITIIPEGTNQYLYYGHLKEQPNLASGTKVKAGQQIALLGNSGATTIYHVHLEISPTPAIGTSASPDPSALITGGPALVQSQQIKVKQ